LSPVAICYFLLPIDVLQIFTTEFTTKAMSALTLTKTKFSIVCCEETEATQKISKAVESWQLPGVRSLIGSEQPPLAVTDAIAQSDYAIFISPCAQPCSQIKVSPLSVAQLPHEADADTAALSDAQSPASLLHSVHSRHGQTPQAWLFQLPATEIRAQRPQPVSTQKSVAQALNQIEIFVRNYTRAIAPTIPSSAEPIAEAAAESHQPPHQPPHQKSAVQKQAALSHYRRI
jgi:hypothetical protein